MRLDEIRDETARMIKAAFSRDDANDIQEMVVDAVHSSWTAPTKATRWTNHLKTKLTGAELAVDELGLQPVQSTVYASATAQCQSAIAKALARAESVFEETLKDELLKIADRFEDRKAAQHQEYSRSYNQVIDDPNRVYPQSVPDARPATFRERYNAAGRNPWISKR